MEFKLVGYDPEGRIAGINNRIRWTKQLNLSPRKGLLFADCGSTTHVSQSETHQRERFPAFEAYSLSVDYVEREAADGYEDEHPAKVLQDLEVSINTIAGHQKRLLKQTLLTCWDLDIQLLAETNS